MSRWRTIKAIKRRASRRKRSRTAARGRRARVAVAAARRSAKSCKVLAALWCFPVQHFSGLCFGQLLQRRISRNFGFVFHRGEVVGVAGGNFQKNIRVTWSQMWIRTKRVRTFFQDLNFLELKSYDRTRWRLEAKHFPQAKLAAAPGREKTLVYVAT